MTDPTISKATRTAEEAEDALVGLFATVYARTVEEMQQKYGEEGFQLARKAFLDSMVEGWEKEFDQLPDRSLSTYVNWLASIVTSGTRFEVIEATESSIRFRFTVCPWATHFRRIGKPEVGRFFCEADVPMVAAFNKIIGFEITKTLMDGDAYCDHHFFIKEGYVGKVC